jgi:glycosyltransferase involved in cell wall biosynthesis
MLGINKMGYVVTVVIPSYNSEKTIGKTLRALSSQKGEIGCEIIVVNSSKDLTPTIIAEKFPWVKCIQLPEKTLAGAARNMGAGIARGKFVAFLDADCLVDGNWMESMLEHYSTEYCAVGGPIANANADNLISLAGHILEFSEFFPAKRISAVTHVPSGNIMLLESTFRESGGYEEGFEYAQEDRLFSWKLIKQTHKKFLFHPGIKVKHIHRTKFRDYVTQQWHIGQGGAEILKITDLRGSNIINNRVLINFIFLLVALQKLSLSLFRTLRWKPLDTIKRPLVIPLLCIGMFSWMLGFVKQANQKGRAINP